MLLAAALAGAASPREGHPERVVTLAPHLAELVYAAGAGDRLVGVSAWTDHPPAAAKLPRVGDAFRLDMERLTVMDPELILAWAEGTPRELVARLEELGFPVLEISTAGVSDVAAALRLIGRRLGTEETAEAAALTYLAALDRAVAGRDTGRRLRVFYQIGARPLYTINGEHYISELIRLCGGRNVYSDLEGLAPVVTVESVLARDPEVILAAGDDPAVLAGWQGWQSLTAVRTGNLRLVPADTLVRPSPRLARGAEDICGALEAARRNLAVDRTDAAQ